MNSLTDSSSDWKAFIDNFPDHIARFNRDFKHLYINRAIENEIQLPASQVIGKSNRDLGIPNQNKALDELENRIHFVFQSGSPTTYYTQHTFPEGTKYYFMKLIPGLLTGTTQVESVWAITREITTLKEYEKKLRRSQKLLLRKNQALDKANANLDTFFYTISHDLRNPLANIKSIVSLLKKVDPQQLETLVALLERSTERLDDILTGLTDLIEVGSKHQTPTRWAFDLILSTIRIEFNQQLAQIGGEIATDFFACPTITYEKPYLESLFRNMISNAIKYRSPDQALHLIITSCREEDFVVITFQDNGIGMDLERFGNKLFKPFYQIETRQEGKGMGLHIVKSMLEKNGGKIQVASQVNKGTTFTTYLKEY